MKLILSITMLLIIQQTNFAQLSPSITSWLQNTTQTGSYYMKGNPTLLPHGMLVNCQLVRYSSNNVYVNATGMPAYNVGPYLDNNPNQAGNQNAIFKIPLNPTENTGIKSPTTGGNIGVFVNGVAMFDFRDGVAWNTATNAWCGGPGNPACPGGMGATQSWMRDAVVFEMQGFDCSKGHPAGTNYHHHQNPSAFELDLNVISTVCNLYDSDGLYVINPEQHSPLIGYAYDGFPMYGAYGFTNTDGTGGITRIKSGYQLRNITERTHHADGTDVPDGPPVNTTYPIGTFREDYEWVGHTGDASYLDIHNGRFCVTPEYPNGTYCYFATVDENHNSAYPYLIGPTYFGVKTGAKVSSVTESTTTYTASISATGDTAFDNMAFNVFPNPSSDFIAIQVNGIIKSEIDVRLMNANGVLISKTQIRKGQTIGYFDIQSLYSGVYYVIISSNGAVKTKKIMIER
jgi:YHYH protein/Secretion system C-terminal sorting domain